jgi:hypothetical protein
MPLAICSLVVVEVIEAYRQYRPASNVRVTVQELLVTVPPGQLSGLARVVLTNALALTGVRKRHWSWYRGKKLRHAAGAAGLYHRATRTEPAWIEVFVDRTLSSAPRWVLRFKFVLSGWLGRVLFHEIGHHIHATQRPEHRQREDVADEWAKEADADAWPAATQDSNHAPTSRLLAHEICPEACSCPLKPIAARKTCV